MVWNMVTKKEINISTYTWEQYLHLNVERPCAPYFILHVIGSIRS